MSNTVDLLPANLQSTLRQIIERTNAANGGIRAILLSTAEGVPLGRVHSSTSQQLNEDVLNSLESTWAPASKQFPLLNMGKEARIVTAIFDHGELRTVLESFALLLLAYLFGTATLGTIFHLYQAPVVSCSLCLDIKIVEILRFHFSQHVRLSQFL